MPAQARTMVARRISGNSSHTVRALIASFSQSITVSLRSRWGVARWPPPITTVPLSTCLNDSLRPRRITTGWMNCGRRLVTVSIGATTVSGTGSPSMEAIRSAQAPAAFTTLGASIAPALVSTRQTSPTLDRPVTVTPSSTSAPFSMARLRNACVERKGSAAPSRRETTPPGQCSDTAGTRRLSSAWSINSSCAKPRILRSSTRALKLASSSSFSATSTVPWLVKPQSSPTSSWICSQRSIEEIERGISARSRASWRTPPAFTPEAWRPA